MHLSILFQIKKLEKKIKIIKIVKTLGIFAKKIAINKTFLVIMIYTIFLKAMKIKILIVRILCLKKKKNIDALHFKYAKKIRNFKIFQVNLRQNNFFNNFKIISLLHFSKRI